MKDIEKASAVLLAADSYIFTDEFQNKLTEDSGEIILRLAETLLREKLYTEKKEIEERLSVLLCSFQLHTSQKLRELTSKFIIQLSTEVPDLGKYYLFALQKSLAVPVGNEQTRNQLSSIYRENIRTIIPKINIDPTSLNHLVLIISHPKISGNQLGQILSLWNSLELGIDVRKNINMLVGSLTEHAFKLYNTPEQQSGALLASEFMVTLIPKSINAFIKQIIQYLNEYSVETISKAEYEISQTEDGVLYDKSVTDKQFLSRSETLKSSQGGKPGKSNQGGNAKGNLRSSASSQQQKGGKQQPQKQQGPTKEQLEQQKIEKQLEIERGIRERVNEKIKYTKNLLTLTKKLIYLFGNYYQSHQAQLKNEKEIDSFFPEIHRKIFKLLENDIVFDLAEECFRELGKLTFFPFELSCQICVIIIKLFSKHKADMVDKETNQLIVSVVSKILALSSNQPLSMTSLIYSSPVIEYTLIHPPTFRAQQNTISIIEKHSDIELEYPRERFISSLLGILNSNLLKDKAEKLITKLSEGMVDKIADDLLNGVYNENEIIRHGCLVGLNESPLLDEAEYANDKLTSTLWFIRFDENQSNKELADDIWETYNQKITMNIIDLLLLLLENDNLFIQRLASKAIANAVLSLTTKSTKEEGDNVKEQVLTKLMEGYSKYLPPEPTVGLRGLEYADDLFAHARRGVGMALSEIPIVLPKELVKKYFQFLLDEKTSPLVDGENDVRESFIQSGQNVIEKFGEEEHDELLNQFEEALNHADQSASGTLVREAIVIFMGILAKFNIPMEKKLFIVDKLVASLQSPSESVQLTVSECLSPILKSIKSDLPKYIDNLFNLLADPNVEQYVRRGAAYGIASIGKGLGVPGLSQFTIMDKLKDLLENKKSIPAREGALFAFECLSKRMQRGFEASAIHKLDHLLICFGDSSPDVRAAAASAAKEIMSQLSNHGVKRVVPVLTKALSDRSWRTKKAAIDLLGSMAFCAPKQLSSCLPEIVPPLIAVLSDTHTQVSKSGRESLGHIASVIRNPEIQEHVSIILKALDDPITYGEDALDKLIKTSYIHVIDAPSLALIMPILQRGLDTQRSTSTKKKAAQIIGNMTKLADHKDLEPYLTTLIPFLLNTLVDLIPETRAISAASLGYLVKGLGEEKFPDLINSLLEKIKSPESMVVRSGAAQGLSQIFSVLPVKRFDNILPVILLNTKHSDAHIREGAISLFVYLPNTLEDQLNPYLPKIIPIVLSGLADETEIVRETSMRAGQSIVSQYGITSLTILLPLLENGLFHENWRIRQSSVKLLGDLLFKIGGEDIENELATFEMKRASSKVLENALGTDKYKSVLAALYLTRSDVVPIVRQQSLIVWKTIVQNTPVILRSILPILMKSIIQCLGSHLEDRRYIGSKTLGELTKKLSELILPTIIPIIEKGLQSNNADTRQGVCLGMTEIINSIRKHELSNYATDLIEYVRRALCDPLEEVRESATKAFDSLFRKIGSRIIDEILPVLSGQLHESNTGSDRNNALDGLREILSVRSQVILPRLIPTLLAVPITEAKYKALISVAEVSGASIYSHSTEILTTVIKQQKDKQDEVLGKLRQQVLESIVVATEEDGINGLIYDILRFVKSNDDKVLRLGGIELIIILSEKSETEYSDHFTQLLQSLILNLNDRDKDVIKLSIEGLSKLVDAIPKDIQPNYISDVRKYLQTLSSPLGRTLEQQQLAAIDFAIMNRNYIEAFSLPKGVTPLLNLSLQGLRNGSAIHREVSAEVIGQLITLTDPAFLQPYATPIIGPLIRVIGDRFPEPVKTEILKTMGILLSKGGQYCKPFVNQLQTIFIKALNDPSDDIRYYAAENLGKLIVLSTRIDQLLSELLNTLSNTDDDRKQSVIDAIFNILQSVSDKVSEKIIEQIKDKLCELVKPQAPFLASVSKVLGLLSKCFAAQPDQKQFQKLANELIFSASPAIGSVNLLYFLEYNSSGNTTLCSKATLAKIQNFIENESETVRFNACRSLDYLFTYHTEYFKSEFASILNILLILFGDAFVNVKILALDIIKKFAKQYPDDCKNHLKSLVPPLMDRVKDRSSLPVKLAAERTLFYVLQVKHNPNVLNDYAATIGQVQAKPIVDYCKRVLIKLEDDSEDEN